MSKWGVFLALVPALAAMAMLGSQADTSPQIDAAPPLQALNGPVIRPVQGARLDGVFPADWHRPELRLRYTPVTDCEAAWADSCIRSELALYPAGFLSRVLEQVIVVRTLEFRGIEAGGTYFGRSIVLSILGVRGHCSGATDLREALHHELSSVILREYGDSFPRAEWLACNPAGFKYLGDGVGAVAAGETNLTPNVLLIRDGFLCAYSRASLEEDFNVTVQHLLSREYDLPCLVRDSPAMQRKLELVKKFLDGIDKEILVRFVSAGAGGGARGRAESRPGVRE